MKDNFDKNLENTESHENTGFDGVNRLVMDEKGRIHNVRSTMAAPGNTKTFIVLGWISAALAAFVQPYFAVAGITFGILANKRARSMGNVVIIANVVLAGINLILRYLFFTVWNIMRGF